MLAHYLRRILGGLLTLLLASFLIYNMFVYMPPVIVDPPPPLHYYIQLYELEHPWPLNYANWLFDPTEPDKLYSMRVERTVIEQTPPYVDVWVGPVHLRGSGLLTGDLGLSGVIDRGTPTIDVTGRGSVSLSIALLICTNIILIAVSIAQRKGRRAVYGAASVPLAAVAWIEATYRYARAAT